MKVKRVLAQKGTYVVTASPELSVAQLCVVLAEHNIGAAVVKDGDDVVGIASERDVVRAVSESGPDVLHQPVSAIMTDIVAVCEPDNSTDDLMVTMTARRIRHVPVIEEGELHGIVSIGDVVRVAMQELEDEKAMLLGYITS
jgi:CBS domain-containing protein